MVKVLFYTDNQLIQLEKYFQGLRWPTRLMKWWLNRQIERRKRKQKN